MATSTRNGDHMDDQNVDWSLGLSLFGDFDPNLSFLDDSALLPGFTPDWTDYQAQNHHENSLTSNEASSDEGEPKKNPSANNLQAPRKRGRPRKTHHDSTPATPATSTTSHSQSSGRGQSQMDRNIDDTRYIYDDTRASASPHNSVALLLRNTNAGESASNSAHPTFLANNGPGAVLMSSRGTRCVTRRAAALRSGGDDGSGAYLGGRGKSSVTGRKKATEEARSVLMDWINDNKDHPYPTRAQKGELAASTGLTVPQIVHWMSNVRKRRLIPLMRGKREPASKIDRKFLEEIAMRNK